MELDLPSTNSSTVSLSCFLDDNSLAPPAPVDSDGESDNSDRVPVPSFQNSFSQAIEAAFMKLDTPATSDPLSEDRGGRKRKKGSKEPQ